VPPSVLEDPVGLGRVPEDPVRCPPPRFIAQSPMPPEVVYAEVYRLLASARSDQATGHWRAISPSVTRGMTVTSGASSAQVRAVRGPDRSDSQADSASSILVTRSRYILAVQSRFVWRGLYLSGQLLISVTNQDDEGSATVTGGPPGTPGSVAVPPGGPFLYCPSCTLAVRLFRGRAPSLLPVLGRQQRGGSG
jgi:hypothetical protein